MRGAGLGGRMRSDRAAQLTADARARLPPRLLVQRVGPSPVAEAVPPAAERDAQPGGRAAGRTRASGRARPGWLPEGNLYTQTAPACAPAASRAPWLAQIIEIIEDEHGSCQVI